jgi:dihydrolipoamide dehydrogenase
MERKVDVAVIGAGSAGLYALPHIRKAHKEFVVIDPGPLGTTCARVGCMPSKAAIHVAEDYHRRHGFADAGISGGEDLRINRDQAWAHVRKIRDFLTSRTLGKSRLRELPQYLEGRAHLLEPTLIDAGGERVRADRVIVAVGSRPVIPPAWRPFENRILTTDSLFEQIELPESIAVLGLGVIGLELGQALARIGVEVTGFDLLETVSGIRDPVVSRAAIELVGRDFPLRLGSAAELAWEGDRVRVTAGEASVVVDRLLVSVGRVSNADRLGFAEIGAPVDERGIPRFDPQTMQVGDLPIFLAGDVTGDRPILHEAADEGRIAGYNAVRDRPTSFRRKTPLAVTFTDPHLVTAGKWWNELDDPDRYEVGEAVLDGSGRAIVMGKNHGVIRVYAEKPSGKLVGAALAAPHGEHLGHLLAWSIQQGMTAYDLLKMPYYHPVIEEALQNAVYDLVAKLGRPKTGLLELDSL